MFFIIAFSIIFYFMILMGIWQADLKMMEYFDEEEGRDDYSLYHSKYNKPWWEE